MDRSDGTLPALRARRLASDALHIDGVLDEPVWQRAASTGPFVHPATGRPEPKSNVNALARVLWDDSHLYVGFVVHERTPSTPHSRDDIDPHIWEGASGVELMIQPGDPGDNRDYFEVQVDVGGALWDTRFDDYNRPLEGSGKSQRFGHQEWSSGVERATSVDQRKGTYSVEIALPWQRLQTARAAVPPEPGTLWRMNFYSFRAGQGDALAWSPLLGKGNFHRASRFGRVELAP